MLSRLLFRLTSALPCRLIDIEGAPYLERYWLGRAFGCTAYLHRFVSGDDERHIHDHPWNTALALVLAGGYLEERVIALCPSYGWLSRWRRMFPGRVNLIRARDFHRITEPKPETWTLFIHGARTKSWGFYERLLADRAVLYHQPLDVESTKHWQLSAPKGRNSNRKPWGYRHAAATPVR